MPACEMTLNNNRKTYSLKSEVDFIDDDNFVIKTEGTDSSLRSLNIALQIFSGLEWCQDQKQLNKLYNYFLDNKREDYLFHRIKEAIHFYIQRPEIKNKESLVKAASNYLFNNNFEITLTNTCYGPFKYFYKKSSGQVTCKYYKNDEKSYEKIYNLFSDEIVDSTLKYFLNHTDEVVNEDNLSKIKNIDILLNN